MLRDKIEEKHLKNVSTLAKNYIEKSCEKGHLASYFYLGMIHENGIGCSKNIEEAVKFYNLAREVEDPQASFRLGLIEQEKGNKDKYYIYTKEAAELGLIEAQHNLGVYYLEEGQVTKGFAWLLNAAHLDFYPSIANVGLIFLNGRGEIQPNPYIAFHWIKRAREIEDSPLLKDLHDAAKKEIDKLNYQI